MKRTNTFTTVILLVVLVVGGCRSTKEASGSADAGLLTENFDRFYDRFHADSSFQVSRISFPLRGYSADSDTVTQWTPENWPMMKTRIYDVDTTIYKVSFKRSPGVFEQKVWLEHSGFSSESRFELKGRKWYLVYVLDLNL